MGSVLIVFLPQHPSGRLIALEALFSLTNHSDDNKQEHSHDNSRTCANSITNIPVAAVEAPEQINKCLGLELFVEPHVNKS